jgi:hypothetical protein
MSIDRPSPFTIPDPVFKFAEGPPAEPALPRSMTVGGLIHNLTIFADFYERASADIDRAEPILKPYSIGNRDANAEVMQRQFRATVAIDRVRAYALAQYRADLTIATARRVLGDLIRRSALTVEAAEALPLETAMDRLEGAAEEKTAGPAYPEADPQFVLRRAGINARTLGDQSGDEQTEGADTERDQAGSDFLNRIADPSKCPGCRDPVPEQSRRIKRRVVCAGCGEWVLHTGIEVIPVAGPPGTPPEIVRTHAPYWRDKRPDRPRAGRPEGTSADRDHTGTKQAEGAAVGKLPPSRKKAMSQYLDAVNKSPGLNEATDRDVYDWIAEHSDGDSLPSFDNWSRYLREARKAAGASKNSPRSGRTGRSVVVPDEI